MWCDLLFCLTVNTRSDVTISHQMLATPMVKVLPCLIWLLSDSSLPEAILYHWLHSANGWEVGKWHIAKMLSRELGSTFLEDKDHLLASTNILYDIKAHHLNWKSEQHRWYKDKLSYLCEGLWYAMTSVKTGLIPHSESHWSVVLLGNSTAPFQVFWRRYYALVQYLCN